MKSSPCMPVKYKLVPTQPFGRKTMGRAHFDYNKCGSIKNSLNNIKDELVLSSKSRIPNDIQ